MKGIICEQPGKFRIQEMHPPEVKAENICTLYEAALEYGKYSP
jgi:hypothetical protein